MAFPENRFQQYFAQLASWFGLSPFLLVDLFPNQVHLDTGQLALFR
ncbi:hypothetical protein [Shewanella sp.]